MPLRLPNSISATILGAYATMGLMTAEIGGYGLYALTNARGSFDYSVLAVLLIALGLSGAIGLVLFRRAIGPLKAAAAIAERIADGEVHAPIPPGGENEAGQLLRSMSIMQQNIRNISEREEAQRRAAPTRLLEALDGAREAIVLVDVWEHVVYANAQLGNFFRLPARPVDSLTFSEIFNPKNPSDPTASEDEDGAAEPALGLADMPSEQQWRLADGRWIRISRSRLGDGGSLLVISDCTESGERERNLVDEWEHAEEASAAKSTFIATMSHELRTPLNAIIGFSEILAGQLFGPLGNEAYVQYSHDIWQSGSHLLAIVNSALDLSKSDAGKLELVYSATDLSDIIESSLNIMRGQCLDAELSLEAHLPDEPLLIRADSAKLRQVLLNLLANAVKFNQPGGMIAVLAQATRDGSVVIQVIDTGIGMSPEEIPLAFVAFGQVDSRLARRYEGTGLGLPLSKAIIQLHGGTIDIDSTPGKGTAVTVTLPRQPALAVAEAEAA